ncbi:MAG: CBS domain-containing protein [Planctomycetes bacterium]|nr:CBS domain-containing protein [Planctomycetota bacterium]
MELKNILTATTVGELTLPPCTQLAPTDTVADAVVAMSSMSHGCAVICEQGKLIGIFTERDLLHVIAEQSFDVPLESVMTKNPRSVSTDDMLFAAAQYMDEGGYRRLPVLNSEGEVVSVLDVKALTHFLVEHFPAAIYNQASHAQLIARHREGA